MPKYEIFETDRFLCDVEEAAVWILQSNLEQSENLALEKLLEFQQDIQSLKVRLREFPESGESDAVPGLRKFPLYGGRYSAKWIVNHAQVSVTLISLADSKYPKQLRDFSFED
jgi:hypothetical protein